MVEENKNVELTEEQIKMVSDTIENENTDEFKPIPESQCTEEIVKEEVKVLANNTGMPFSTEEINIAKTSFDELCEMDPDEVKEKVEVIEDSIKSAPFLADLDMSPEDINKMLNAINRYRKGEKFNYFNELPDRVKNMINETVSSTMISGMDDSYLRSARKEITKELFDNIINDNYINRMYIDMQDMIDTEFDKAVAETKEALKKYNDKQRETFENIFPKAADELESKGDEKSLQKADQLRKATDAFIQSYTYTDMRDLYMNSGKIRIKGIDIEKFDSRCKDFCFKYRNTKFIINDIRDVIPGLVSTFDGVLSEDQIKKFLVVFMKYTMNMNPDVIHEHIFMYYFIKHLIMLSHQDENDEDDVKFYNEIKDRIQSFIEECIEVKCPTKNK